MLYEVTVNSFKEPAYAKNLRRIGVPFSAEQQILTFSKVFLTKNPKANVKP
jgi:hypothetical protein